MTNIVPTIGRIVLYRMSQRDIDAVRNMHPHFRGNRPKDGDVLPAIVVAVEVSAALPDGINYLVNLKVQIDGQGDYWAPRRAIGDAEGEWQWMPYQLGQAAKTEAAEASLADRVKAIEEKLSYTPDHDRIIAELSSAPPSTIAAIGTIDPGYTSNLTKEGKRLRDLALAEQDAANAALQAEHDRIAQAHREKATRAKLEQENNQPPSTEQDKEQTSG